MPDPKRDQHHAHLVFDEVITGFGRLGAPFASDYFGVKPDLFTTAKGTKVVRSLDPGMMLYPTGNKEGMMWEVEDELGNKGWISSTLIELSR